MHFFDYKESKFYADGVSIEKIIREVGTPCYIYSHKTLTRHYHAFDEAFKDMPHLVCYSVKANSNIAILKTFVKEGSGFDIVSGGELYRALKAGVNPNVDPKTHPYISTGLKKNKFGIETNQAIKEYVYAKSHLKNLIPFGVDCHIGSQITQLSPFIDALNKTREIIVILRREGVDVQYLDIGGGLGITYKDEDAPHPSKYGKVVINETKTLGVTLIFEPGRVMVGNAGILVAKVLYTKYGMEKNFIVVDAAMNDLARPSLYGSYHSIKSVNKQNSAPAMIADVVGPICESGDFFAKDREISAFQSGDLMSIMSAGAYGFSMSSNYNSRPRAAEVMVKGNRFYIIRDRESYKDLIKGEKIPKDRR